MFSISCISLTAICLLLAAYVYLSNSKRALNKSWLFLSLSVAVWSLGLGLMISSQSVSTALFWVRIHYLGASFIPAAYYHFICSLLDSYDKKSRFNIKLLYLISCLFLILTVSGNLFVQLPQQQLSFKFYTVAGPLYNLYVLFFFVAVSYSISLLLKRYNQLKGYKRNQIKYIIVASLIGFLGGATAFLPVFGIKLYPYGMHFVFLYPLIITYAIVRYRLMDIVVIIRQAVISATVFGFLVGAFVLGMLFGDEFLSNYLGKRQWAVPFLALFIVIFIAKPIERIVDRVIGKLFFRRKYEYKKILRDAASGMVGIRE
ncbi:MAG: histidine kinase N-terminal 7TM domain-containing protein, partial [Candidatus Omnitrophota bacterium]